MAQVMTDAPAFQEKLGQPGDGNPLFLVLGRKGIVDTELKNPHTDETVYRIRDTGRGSMSSKPDLEVYRTPASDLFVGSIRYGRISNEINMPLTGTKAKGLDKVKLHHITGETNDYVWKVVKSKRKSVRDRWSETGDNGHAELYTNEEVIILELVEEKNGTKDPICVVRLYNTQPNGLFEIWAKDAWVEQGGNWNALDELVVSAYAKMEATKRKLMSGLDPGSMRFVGPA